MDAIGRLNMGYSASQFSDYKKRLITALEKKEKFVTQNHDNMHAVEIIIAGFTHAKREINLLSHKLDQQVYGNDRVIDAMEGFLKRDDAKLNIIVETRLPTNHPIYNLKENFGTKISLKKIPDEWVEKYAFNYMLMDNFGYRFEYDREEFKARASFNNDEQKETLGVLKKSFQSLDSLSEAA